MLKKFLAVLMLAILGPLTYADNLMLDSARDISSWKYINGGEFPGAKGTIEVSQTQPLELNYDFTKGGCYVGMEMKRKIPAGIKTITIGATATNDCNVCYRVTDATGRVFQGKPVALTNNKKQEITIDVNGKWHQAWGGAKSPTPKQPLKSILFFVQKAKGKPLAGKVALCPVLADFSNPPVSDFSGNGNSLQCSGWDVNVEWLPVASGATLKINAVGDNAENAVLSICFPRASRDKVKRFNLAGKEGKYELFYNVPLKDGGNPRNIYKIDMKLQAANGSIASKKLQLVGKDSYDINFGKPVSSMEVKSSAVGTCGHFSYGLHPVFKSWKPYRQLIDMISACGFKWIRDQCKFVKNKDGSYSVRPYDLEWMKYARSKNLNIILLVFIGPDDQKRNLAMFDAVLRDTKGLVNVFEIGNEPNNFNYRPKLKGSWNGYEKDGSISKWVKVFVKHTNEIADHVKKIRPDAITIGLGACSPTNFHMLNLGVTKNLDGVTDHPYSYSMPPEKIPFGLALTKRDGIKVGDANHTYAGLINSYVEHFKKTGKMRSIWETEFGYTTFWFHQGNQKGLSAGFTEQAQAVYLVRRFLENMTLPVKVACQYDFMDDYHSAESNGEANFGIVRTDMSPKTAYYAIQRMNSLYNGWKYDLKRKVIVEDDTLHRSCKRSELVKKWDDASIKADNGIEAFISSNPDKANEKILTVWSKLPYSGEFNSRGVKLRIKNMKEFNAKPVIIDIITGKSYDMAMKVDGNDLVINDLVIKNNPLAIKLFRK